MDKQDKIKQTKPKHYLFSLFLLQFCLVRFCLFSVFSHVRTNFIIKQEQQQKTKGSTIDQNTHAHACANFMCAAIKLLSHARALHVYTCIISDHFLGKSTQAPFSSGLGRQRHLSRQV